MYDKGTIKLTFLSPNDYTVLESAMYDTVEQALEKAKGVKDFLIFRLDEVVGDAYKWKMLPYGSSQQFLSGVKIKNSSFAHLMVATVLGLAIYGVFKMIK